MKGDLNIVIFCYVKGNNICEKNMLMVNKIVELNIYECLQVKYVGMFNLYFNNENGNEFI